MDARLSNEFQDPWGVWYFSVWQLAALLDHCNIMFAEDLEDAYHLSIFSGCTGRPMWSPVFVVDGSILVVLIAGGWLTVQRVDILGKPDPARVRVTPCVGSQPGWSGSRGRVTGYPAGVKCAPWSWA